MVQCVLQTNDPLFRSISFLSYISPEVGARCLPVDPLVRDMSLAALALYHVFITRWLVSRGHIHLC